MLYYSAATLLLRLKGAVLNIFMNPSTAVTGCSGEVSAVPEPARAMRSPREVRGSVGTHPYSQDPTRPHRAAQATTPQRRPLAHGRRHRRHLCRRGTSASLTGHGSDESDSRSVAGAVEDMDAISLDNNPNGHHINARLLSSARPSPQRRGGPAGGAGPDPNTWQEMMQRDDWDPDMLSQMPANLREEFETRACCRR